ncbi:EAL domain-containing protein [Klebsiella quasipneumoniae]|uniref:EAL domain-containing protein n=1 Tax=Klebsiella quasipneumoniae TaxID=1463165 RepID=UPI0022E842D3|nr:EAL domain-containing protein [Klebsiella quasipneumoniae]
MLGKITEQAWNTGGIHRSLNAQGDEWHQAWRWVIDTTGIRSSVAIPLVSPKNKTVISVLSLYSKFTGGLSSSMQESFLIQLQALLEFGISRFEEWNNPIITIPYTTRLRWIDLLERNGLEMHYQPVVDLQTGKIVKVEALARIYDDGQVLTPGQFLSVLSSENFFKLYVNGLTQALKQRAAWISKGIVLDISLNLPVAGLEDERYVAATERMLAEYVCPPSSLTLEVLENEKNSSLFEVNKLLLRYKHLGIKLAEDDLGAGYSSLVRMKDIPFDIIKIDRSLILNNTGEEQYDTLRFVYHLTSLGHSLGKKVIVEGVEDFDLLDAIAILGVDYVQGYVVSPPVPASKLEGWIATQTPFTLSSSRTPGFQSILAKLLIWEEGMKALLNMKPDLFSNESTYREICNLLGPMALTPHEQEDISSLISCVASSGLNSPAYKQARKRIIDSVLQKNN